MRLRTEHSDALRAIMGSSPKKSCSEEGWPRLTESDQTVRRPLPTATRSTPVPNCNLWSASSRIPYPTTSHDAGTFQTIRLPHKHDNRQDRCAAWLRGGVFQAPRVYKATWGFIGLGRMGE